MSKEYLDKVSPTYIENWPAALCSLSIAQVDIPLTLDEATTLGSHISEFGEAFTRKGELTPITNRVIQAVKKFPNGAFIRLGSRSPKDAWTAEENQRVTIPEGPIVRSNHPLRFMLETSERMYEDLTLAIENKYAPHIFVRQWVDIKKDAEFRCFMKGRKLVGISQYNYPDGPVADLQDDVFREAIRWAIEKFFETFRKVCHLDDAVFDVYYRIIKNGCYWAWELRLIEINPFFEMTDPCLFDWRNGGESFDGSFKYVIEEKK